MKKTKRRLEVFSFFNSKAICIHLEEMAKKGWMIEKLTNFGWVYRSIEPKNIHFSVSYFPKASEFDSEPTEEQKMFHEFCAHTGWKLACTSAQLQIFYNEEEAPIPIETEPELELYAVHSTAKRNFIPTNLVLILLALLQAYMFLGRLYHDPIGLLSNPSQLTVGFCFLLILFSAVTDLVCYIRWYGRAKKAAEQGVFLTPPDTSFLHKMILGISLLGLSYWFINVFFSGDPLKKWLAILFCFYMPVLYFLVNGTKNLLKRRKASRKLNRTLTLVISYVLSFTFLGAITVGMIRANAQGMFRAEQEETYEHGGMTWVIHQDELPLCIEDLMEVEYDGYIKERRGEESIFLGQLTMRQQPRFDAEDYNRIPQLEYTMTVVKMPSLYDWCKERLISDEEEKEYLDGQEYRMEDAASWGANEVYHLYDAKYGYSDAYLLCYDNVLVEIIFDWEPTEEQKRIVGRTFSQYL